MFVCLSVLCPYINVNNNVLLCGTCWTIDEEDDNMISWRRQIKPSLPLRYSRW